ncbi:MAG: hypothetical protein HC895_04240 [Leptolyngbyaceae cyanobacterium SM1_3_5]|nr:hypothetical protein [Leptolyngbyaceae cyanobacterium SM1_3_5]
MAKTLVQPRFEKLSSKTLTGTWVARSIAPSINFNEPTAIAPLSRYYV